MKQVIKITAVFLIGFVFFFVPSFVFAAAQVSISNLPLAIDQSQEFEIDINFSCPGCGDSYLRGVFYPSGSSYFGYTQDNAGNWSNAPGGSCITYFKIAELSLTPEGSFSGKLKFKPDTGSSYYSGPGEYLFKIGRYTPSCGSPSVWSQEATIAITGPTPTPTQAPTSATTSTPTPTPTKTPTAIPVTVTMASSSAEILGESTDSALIFEDTITPISKRVEIPKETKVLGENNSAKVVMSIGVIFMIACGILAFRSYKQYRKKELEN